MAIAAVVVTTGGGGDSDIDGAKAGAQALLDKTSDTIRIANGHHWGFLEAVPYYF